MKVSLVVMTAGKSMGKVIPIVVPQFIIGRDPECHLRPASVLISKRHCAVVARAGKVFLHDFNSTNGTFINNRQIKGEIELQPGDRLKIGPLEFDVRIEGAGVPGQTPTPPTKQPAAGDEAAAALLLGVGEGDKPPGSPGVDSEGVPTGSTEIKLPPVTPAGEKPPGEEHKAEPGKPGGGKPPAAKPPSGDTSSAAKAILEKYLRRPRP